MIYVLIRIPPHDNLLTLFLLVFRILADNHYFAIALNDLAFFADWLYGSSYFHFFVPPDLLLSPGNSASCQVVR